MEPLTLFGIALVVLVGTASVAFTAGLYAGAYAHRRIRDAAEGDDAGWTDEEEDAYERFRERARNPPAHVNCRSSFVPLTENEATGEGTDEEVEALGRVRASDNRELRGSPRGFRGADLSDREVRDWLRRWNL